MIRKLMLAPLARYEDVSWLLLRVLTGLFLVHGSRDNFTSTERMQEFVVFPAVRGSGKLGFDAMLE